MYKTRQIRTTETKKKVTYLNWNGSLTFKNNIDVKKFIDQKENKNT